MLNPLEHIKYYYEIIVAQDRDFFSSKTDIEKEVMYYKEQFNGKRVLCNCNDIISSFGEFFNEHFDELNLKSLTLTGYTDQKNVADMVYRRLNSDNVMITPIDSQTGKGDWTAMLKSADIVVTNPPARQIGMMIRTLIAHNKKFLLMANLNAVMYADILPYFVRKKITVGVTRPCYFYPSAEWYVLGNKVVPLGNMIWLTNMDCGVERLPLPLTESIHDPENTEKYPTVDGTDIVWVNKVKEIPYDYTGLMAVPVNYIQVHNPNQFRIVGEVNHGQDNVYDYAKPIVDGETKYKHLVICRTEEGNDHD